jgi:CheY-like chemotaxis protein
MAKILLIGTDEALLEGLSQSLAAAGHTPRIATSVTEGLESAAAELPLLSIVPHSLALARPELLHVLPTNGSALLLYRTLGGDTSPLPPRVQRLVLADLMLPLERHRLLALVQFVEHRARTTGRVMPAPPEPRAE